VWPDGPHIVCKTGIDLPTVVKQQVICPHLFGELCSSFLCLPAFGGIHFWVCPRMFWGYVIFSLGRVHVNLLKCFGIEKCITGA